MNMFLINFSMRAGWRQKQLPSFFPSFLKLQIPGIRETHESDGWKAKTDWKRGLLRLNVPSVVGFTLPVNHFRPLKHCNWNIPGRQVTQSNFMNFVKSVCCTVFQQRHEIFELLRLCRYNGPPLFFSFFVSLSLSLPGLPVLSMASHWKALKKKWKKWKNKALSSQAQGCHKVTRVMLVKH